MKHFVLLIALANILMAVDEFDPDHAFKFCGVVIPREDKCGSNPDTPREFIERSSRYEIKTAGAWFLHKGPCDQPYCSTEHYCTCGNDGKAYYNICHMRSLGVVCTGKCSCPEDEGNDCSCRGPDAGIKNEKVRNIRPLSRHMKELPR